ncbi:glycine--tRNA ligase subunit beta, partial [Brevundimonas sp.]|uniref:glycine--tRNA ligase subunit beta n=1 Tax=Brevundimonas sp. TaxID=1871086 RepID=UPI002ED9E35B
LAGYPDAVADAVRDHYKPQGPGDSVPTAPVTVAVAIAEKLDTLVGFFAIDEKPTGSRDPYALRRAALGVIRLVLENGARARLRTLIVLGLSQILPAIDPRKFTPTVAAGLEELADRFAGTELGLSAEEILSSLQTRDEFDDLPWLPEWVENDAPELLSGIVGFFADRLTVLLRDQGQRHDLVAAVFALGDDDLVRIVRRVEALAAFLATDDGANLLAGYKRASNILKAEEKKGPLPEGAVATGLANQPAEETALAFAAAAAATAVDAALETEDFAAAMTALAALRGPVDAFFTGVMVNSDVAEERENRLKLLGQVRGVMGRVADFGQIAG